MDKTEKLHLMEKILRELDDVVNSQTSLLKKVAQLEAENINLGNSFWKNNCRKFIRKQMKPLLQLPLCKQNLLK